MPNQVPDLEKELMFGKWYLYKCNHIAEGTYPEHGLVPVGPYANILVCKHCWQHLKNMFLVELLKEMIRGNQDETLRELLTALVDKLVADA